MLLELINGNLDYRINFDDSDSQFADLATSLNSLAEKMQLTKYKNPYTNPSKLNVDGDDPAIILVRNAQDYILNHLEEPLPSTKELSEIFGTNEFTLKQSFRNLLKTSVYQYYNDERLKKANNLILQTNIPLKQIAYLCGFSSYTNFFKAFKKKFNSSPGELVRDDSNVS